MINLNDKIKARQQTNEKTVSSNNPIPEGVYDVVVDEIKPWVQLVKDTVINRRDEMGRLIKDANGQVVKDTIKNYAFYTCDIRLSIVGGEFANRKIYSSLTTHPNAVFITQGFLYAIGEGELTYGQIQTRGLGKTLRVETKNETYDKKAVNPDTGSESVETRVVTRVKTFLRPTLTTKPDDDLGF